MTSYEHAMLGINGVLATGLQRRYGWPLVALAAVAAVSPDWDGLAIVAGAGAFAAAHRVWGHNLLACLLSGIVLGALDYRFDLVTRGARFLVRRLHITWPGPVPQLRSTYAWGALAVWSSVAVLAAASHLVADLVVSGTASLPDWELPLWWPFSSKSYVYPLIAWGDPGLSIVFVVGMFAMWRWPARVQGVAAATLAAVVLYGLFALVLRTN